MGPAGQGLHAITPGRDVLKLGGNIKAEFFGRVVEVTGKRDVGDGWLIAQKERHLRKPLIDDAEIAVDPSLEESQHGRIAGGSREVFQEPVRPKEPVYLLIVENDPPQRLQARIFGFRFETASAFGQVGENYSRLAELPGAVCENRDLAHFIDLGPVFRRPRFAALEEIDKDRLPIGANQIEHKCGAISIARLGEAIESIFRHKFSLGFKMRIVMAWPA